MERGSDLEKLDVGIPPFYQNKTNKLESVWIISDKILLASYKGVSAKHVFTWNERTKMFIDAVAHENDNLEYESYFYPYFVSYHINSSVYLIKVFNALTETHKTWRLPTPIMIIVCDSSGAYAIGLTHIYHLANFEEKLLDEIPLEQPLPIQKVNMNLSLSRLGKVLLVNFEAKRFILLHIKKIKKALSKAAGKPEIKKKIKLCYVSEKFEQPFLVIIFSDEFIVGINFGQLVIVTLSTQEVKYLPFDNIKPSSLCFPTPNRVLVGFMNGAVRLLNLKTLETEREWLIPRLLNSLLKEKSKGSSNEQESLESLPTSRRTSRSRRHKQETSNNIESTEFKLAIKVENDCVDIDRTPRGVKRINFPKLPSITMTSKESTEIIEKKDALDLSNCVYTINMYDNYFVCQQKHGVSLFSLWSSINTPLTQIKCSGKVSSLKVVKKSLQIKVTIKDSDDESSLQHQLWVWKPSVVRLMKLESQQNVDENTPNKIKHVSLKRFSMRKMYSTEDTKINSLESPRNLSLGMEKQKKWVKLSSNYQILPYLVDPCSKNKNIISIKRISLFSLYHLKMLSHSDIKEATFETTETHNVLFYHFELYLKRNGNGKPPELFYFYHKMNEIKDSAYESVETLKKELIGLKHYIKQFLNITEISEYLKSVEEQCSRKKSIKDSNATDEINSLLGLQAVVKTILEGEFKCFCEWYLENLPKHLKNKQKNYKSGSILSMETRFQSLLTDIPLYEEFEDYLKRRNAAQYLYFYEEIAQWKYTKISKNTDEAVQVNEIAKKFLLNDKVPHAMIKVRESNVSVIQSLHKELKMRPLKVYKVYKELYKILNLELKKLFDDFIFTLKVSIEVKNELDKLLVENEVTWQSMLGRYKDRKTVGYLQFLREVKALQMSKGNKTSIIEATKKAALALDKIDLAELDSKEVEFVYGAMKNGVYSVIMFNVLYDLIFQKVILKQAKS